VQGVDIVYAWPEDGDENFKRVRVTTRTVTLVVFGNRSNLTLKIFFLQVGFRRVGTTPFLAYALNDEHPSRQLPISKDVVRAFLWYLRTFGLTFVGSVGT
jgi:hypothetical protein